MRCFSYLIVGRKVITRCHTVAQVIVKEKKRKGQTKLGLSQNPSLLLANFYIEWAKAILKKEKVNMKAVIKITFPVFLRYFLLGSSLLFIFYFTVLFLVTKDFTYPVSQFRALNPWISILIAGFGIQSGLFGLIRKGYMLRVNKKEINLSLGTSSLFSGASMVACCAHHLADVIPILGVAGLSVFLTEFQKEALMIGVAMNFIGVFYMLWILTGKEKPRQIISLLFS